MFYKIRVDNSLSVPTAAFRPDIHAQKIIELAQRGFKNPTALHLAAMKEFKSAQ